MHLDLEFRLQIQVLNIMTVYIVVYKEILCRLGLISSTHMRAPLQLGARSKNSLMYYANQAVANFPQDSSTQTAKEIS